MNTMHDSPNVVSEETLRALLKRGYCAHVICRTPPYRRAAAQWVGVWSIDCSASDGSERRILVTARNNSARREFKTINGLTSFLHGLGIDIVSIPMGEGKSAANKLDLNPL